MVNAIFDFIEYKRAHDAGRDEEIARESAIILARTEFGKKALQEFTSNPGSADDFLRQLEPK